MTASLNFRRLLTGTALAAALMSASTVVDAQCYGEPTHDLWASDGGALHRFGASVDLWQNFMLVGAEQTTVIGGTGQAYVFRRFGGAWLQAAPLIASDAATGDRFGSAVAIESTVALIGAQNDGSGTSNGGTAYVFRRGLSGWTEEQELWPANISSGDGFGGAVDLSGNWALVGSPTDNEGVGSNVGSAYLFEYDGATWIERQTLSSPNQQIFDHFADAVAIDGTRLVVGTPLDDLILQDAGAAYVYEYDGSQWSYVQTLTPTNAAVGREYGQDVDLDGDLMVVGAVDEVYVYRHNGNQWVEEQVLVGGNTVAGDWFGTTVGLDATSELIAVGAQEADVLNGFESGAVYTFRFDGADWQEVMQYADNKINPSQTYDFGKALAVHSGRVVAGSSDDTLGLLAGAVHVMSPPDLGLYSSPFPTPGFPITLNVCGGTPGLSTAMFVTAVDGVPFVQPLFYGTFGTGGDWSFTGLVPNDPTLSGISVDLLSFGMWASGEIVVSNTETVDVQ